MSGYDGRIAAAYVEACLAELDALKPGNVHRFAAGHGMQVADFVRSAEVSAAWVAARGARVGARVRTAVEATLKAVGQNTNLGIILLSAPLAAAAEARGSALRPALALVLDGLDQADAADVFAAIAAANPGGLGRVARHDVNAPAATTLREAMAEAAERDRIARQYVTAYEDIFALGLPALAAARERHGDARWPALAVYLAFLGAIPDTHIARKFGASAAEAVRREAADWGRAFAAARHPHEIEGRLMDWDAALKSRGVNPGTSADLTVATLFASSLKSLGGEKS
ncbi:MAG TPA: triphosphoribosyl-dephospho-CoA synthase [Roseiarcus sp.]|nr:triphosphoribosyl-dephospho-CoA synthase [Roseiarcus sp.]